MKQMNQCGKCGTLSPLNQTICPHCGENLILNGKIVNVGDDGRVYPMEMMESQPFDVTYDNTELPKPQPQPQPQPQPAPQPKAQSQQKPKPQSQPKPQQKAQPKQTPPPSPKKKGGFGKFLLKLCLIAAIGTGGYFVWNEFLNNGDKSTSRDVRGDNDDRKSGETLSCTGSTTQYDMAAEVEYDGDGNPEYFSLIVEVDAGSSSTAKSAVAIFEDDPEAALEQMGLSTELADAMECRASGSKLIMEIAGEPDDLGIYGQNNDIDDVEDDLEYLGLDCSRS